MRRALFFSMTVAAACRGSHSALELRETTAAPASATATVSVTGAGGGGGTGGYGGEAGVETVSTSAAETSTSSGPVEPPGPTKLTFVNGLADQDVTRFCFVKYPAGPSSETPWPSGGLAFARAAILTPAALPSNSDIEVRAVAGSATDVGTKNCAELSAMPSGVLVRSLGVLPQSALVEPKSILLVSYGCMGGPGHTGGLQTLICGQGYKADAGTAMLLAGFMSRLGDNLAVRTQFVDAVGAIYSQAQVGAALVPGADNASPLVIAPTLPPGAIAPFPPYEGVTLSGLTDLAKVKLEFRLYGNPTPILLPEALKNGGLTAADVVDGKGYAFIAVGAQPGIGDGAWWHKLTFTAVRADP